MRWQPDTRTIRGFGRGLFLACLLPLGLLALDAVRDTLGTNPVETAIRSLGDWALNFLLITLAVTPLRRLTGWDWVANLRRMFGLYAFFYASLHLAGYVWLDQYFDWGGIVRDIVKRPFITAGFLAYLLLVPMAGTLTSAIMGRLGRRRWEVLHGAIYAVAPIAIVHYALMVKRDLALPLVYGVALLVLFAFRVWPRPRGSS